MDGPATTSLDSGAEGRAPAGRAAAAWERWGSRAQRARARVTRTRPGEVLWRAGVGVVGGTVVLAGVVMIPGPGQGWATVFLGLALLSTEFRWARRLRLRVMRDAGAARQRYLASSRRVRVAVVVLTALVCVVALAGVFWATLVLSGVPGWLPEWVRGPLQAWVPGVD